MQFGAHIFGVGALAEPATLVEVVRLVGHLGYHTVYNRTSAVPDRHPRSP